MLCHCERIGRMMVEYTFSERVTRYHCVRPILGRVGCGRKACYGLPSCLVLIWVGWSCTVRAYELEDLFATTSHDFGSVARGGDVAHRFELRNTTPDTLKITSVRSSCDCASVEVSTKSIPPGGTCDVDVQMDTRSYVGRRSATVTLTFDGTTAREVQLRLSAYIRSDIEVLEGALQFGQVEGGKKAERRLVIAVRRGGCQINGLTTDSRYFESSWKEIGRSESGHRYEVVLRLRRSAPAGVFRIPVEVSVTDRRVKRLVLLADGEISGPLSVCEHLILGTVAPGATQSCNLVIRGREAFEISRISCEDHRFSFQQVRTGSEGKVHVVRVSFRADPNDRRGTFEREVTIEAKMASGASSCRVRISGVVRVK